VERKYTTFSEWLQLRETATSTGDIAGFKRMTLPMVTRQWVGHWGDEDPFFKKKKKKKNLEEEWKKADRNLDQRYRTYGKEVNALNWAYK
jgi:hypothetical protein